ncbi:hypothetical protein C8J57DRAFT_1725916 [Mycena rebaudengoi]|nr:hypothetical protein C8J57DRAFT_1725916 [Mycena rebaudengoi]
MVRFTAGLVVLSLFAAIMTDCVLDQDKALISPKLCGCLFAPIAVLLERFIFPFSNLFSPLEKLIILGPASVLVASLLLQTTPWVAYGLIRVVVQRRRIHATIFFSLSIAGAILYQILNFAVFAKRILFVPGIEAATPIWHPLKMGHKILLVVPPMAYYLRFYLARSYFARAYKTPQNQSSWPMAGKMNDYAYARQFTVFLFATLQEFGLRIGQQERRWTRQPVEGQVLRLLHIPPMEWHCRLDRWIVGDA